MKTIIKDGKTRNSFLLIFLCFFFTSSGYLSWLYNLMRFTDNTTSDILSEVLGYILQAIGVFVFVYLIKNKIIQPQPSFPLTPLLEKTSLLTERLSLTVRPPGVFFCERSHSAYSREVHCCTPGDIHV